MTVFLLSPSPLPVIEWGGKTGQHTDSLPIIWEFSFLGEIFIYGNCFSNRMCAI